MGDNSSSNITQLVTSFESFLKILEDPDWLRSATIEDIKNSFKLGNFIEKTTEHFKTQNTLEKFLSLLKKWLGSKNRTKVCSADVYAVACDELLIKFFSCANISENTLDIAVRIYTSVFSKHRFEEVMTRLLLNAGTLEALSEYIKTSFSEDNVKCLDFHLKLQHWDSLLQKGEINSMKEEIESMLAPYNVENFLCILIGVLSLTDLSEEQQPVQEFILNIILEKMAERTILTRQFWNTMFKTIETSTLWAVCNNFPDFLKSHLNFIVHVGSMMKEIGGCWKCDTNICFYPEIEYDDIVNHICELCKVNDNMRQVVVARLNEAKENTGIDIWKKVLNNLEG